MSHSCNCSELPSYVPYKREQDNAIATMRQLKEAPKQWKNYINYRKCSICGQIWKVEENNNLKGQLAFKVPKNIKFDQFDETPLRINYIESSYGIDDSKKCKWNSCEHNVLKGMEICAWHAYTNMGTRN